MPRRRDIDFSPSKTLCWTCEHSCGGCSWSEDFTPVPGWDADQTYIASSGLYSYLVYSCPEFKKQKDERRNAQDLDTEGCMQLLEAAMRVARRDYIVGGWGTRHEVEQFVLDWLPGGTHIISELRKAAAEWDKKMTKLGEGGLQT